jgi:hypothetical protein
MATIQLDLIRMHSTTQHPPAFFLPTPDIHNTKGGFGFPFHSSFKQLEVRIKTAAPCETAVSDLSRYVSIFVLVWYCSLPDHRVHLGVLVRIVLKAMVVQRLNQTTALK